MYFPIAFIIAFALSFHGCDGRKVEITKCEEAPAKELLDFKNIDISCLNNMDKECVLKLTSSPVLAITILPKSDIRNLTISGSSSGVNFFTDSPCSESPKYCNILTNKEIKWGKKWDTEGYFPITAEVEFKFFDANSAKQNSEYSCFATTIALQQ